MEIARIWQKYEEEQVLDHPESLEEVNRLALTFTRDVANTYKLITIQSNPARKPFGHGFQDAPIVGLLTRVAKLLRLVCKFYELNNGEYLTLFSRPLIESAIVATYLLRNGEEAVEDYRRCAYKDTLRILREHENESEFFSTRAGQRVLCAARNDLALEGLSRKSFTVQKKNSWRLQGKSIYSIFGEVTSPDEYPFVYGVLSESIHGSWNESLDWCLSRNHDGTFSAYPLFIGVDVRSLLPLVRYATPPYALWLEKIGLMDDTIQRIVDCIQDYSHWIYEDFEELYVDSIDEDSTNRDLK